MGLTPLGKSEHSGSIPSLSLFLVGNMDAENLVWKGKILNDLSKVALDDEEKLAVPGLTHFMKMHGQTGIRSLSLLQSHGIITSTTK